MSEFTMAANEGRVVSNILLTSNFNCMKKIISLIKRGAKAYVKQAAKTCALTPSGTIPMGV